MTRTLTTLLTSFNRYPIQKCTMLRPERYRELIVGEQATIARGQGCSYGDAALNENAQIILTERLNRFIEFDCEQGILTAEAGVTLSEILAVIVPSGWFLPVTPGTQHVSLGGCVASDVHGKNHHGSGSFGQHVLWFELITASNKKIFCSPCENADIFWATVGGMGLTGVIVVVSIKLIPITTRYLSITHHTAKNLAQTINYLNDPKLDDRYSVAWLDAFAHGKNLGRSIIMTAHHADEKELPPGLRKNPLHSSKSNLIDIPRICPSWLLNKMTLKVFNQFYYYKQRKQSSPYFSSYEKYFYPLDNIQHWNRLYGKRGFIQYQCVFPPQEAQAGIMRLLEHLHISLYPAFLGVLKRFAAANPGMLSFPMAGFALALDLPILNTGLFALLDKMDDIVVHHGGRIYLAKDARLKPEMFRKMYPELAKWQDIKKKCDPKNIFSSSLARRLEI